MDPEVAGMRTGLGLQERQGLPGRTEVGQGTAEQGRQGGRQCGVLLAREPDQTIDVTRQDRSAHRGVLLVDGIGEPKPVRRRPGPVAESCCA